MRTRLWTDSDNVRQSWAATRDRGENSAILLRALRQTALQHKSRRRRSSHEAIPAAGSLDDATPAAAAAAVVGRRHEEVPAARRAELDAAAAAWDTLFDREKRRLPWAQRVDKKMAAVEWARSLWPRRFHGRPDDHNLMYLEGASLRQYTRFG